MVQHVLELLEHFGYPGPARFFSTAGPGSGQIRFAPITIRVATRIPKTQYRDFVYLSYFFLLTKASYIVMRNGGAARWRYGIGSGMNRFDTYANTRILIPVAIEMWTWPDRNVSFNFDMTTQSPL